MQREDIVLTDDARVASIQLSAREASAWHYHSEVIENIICLTGSIKLQYGKEGEFIILQTGQRYEVAARLKHNLVNMDQAPSTYLLIQKGVYDFVSVD